MNDKINLSSAFFECKGEVEVPMMHGMEQSIIKKKGAKGVGLCDTHAKNPSYMSAAPHVMLNKSLLFINEAYNGRVSMVRTKDIGSEKMVYGEVTFEGKAPISFTATRDKISYRSGEKFHHPYECFPIVAYAIAFDDEVRKNCDIALASPKYENLLQFCDSVYYDYVKQFPKAEIEIKDDLVIETIKAAYQSGTFEDISKSVKGKGCTLFADLSARKGVGEAIGTYDARLWDEYKSGSHRIKDYIWDLDDYRYIPDIESLNDYVPTDKFFEVVTHVEKKVKVAVDAINSGKVSADDKKKYCINVLLYGDPGTGKSRMMHAIGAILGIPVHITTLTEDSEGDEFTGKTKIVAGQFTTVETEFLKGWQNGGITLLEEINLARANVATGELNQALEYPYVVMKDGYEKVERHPLTIVVGTMNLGTDGTTALNSALSQRFIHKYEVLPASAEESKNILKSFGYPRRNIECIYDVYESIRETLKSSKQMSKYLKELSIRQCVGALELMDEGRDARGAVIDTMYGALCVKDRNVANTICDACINSMRELDSYPEYEEDDTLKTA